VAIGIRLQNGIAPHDYYASNHLYSVAALADSTGTMVERFQ
jgi:hypothetical protein